MAWRLQHIQHSAEKYAGTVEKTAGGQLNWTGKVNIIEKEFIKPFTWKKPVMVFVNSESDLFHESVPFQVVRALFGVMSVCKEHTFQILTKRPQRMLDFFKWLELMDPDMQDDPANYAYDLCVQHGIETGCGSAFETEAWPLKNVWLGVSVENQQTANKRIPLLLQVPAAVRFLSCEPLLGPVDLMQDQLRRKDGSYPFPYLADKHRTKWLHNIDWVIVGGESGKDARPMHPDWVRSLRDQCTKTGTAFFFKQFGEFIPSLQAGEKAHETANYNKSYGERWVKNSYLFPDGTCVVKVGKKAAGRLLDGREWNEFPVSGKRSEPAQPAEDPDLYFTGGDY
jgi:protein gp37